MVERIKELMQFRGVNESTLTRELKLGNGIFTQWKNGKAKPSTDAIIKIAEYFNVTTDWLLTGKEPYTEVSRVPDISIARAYERAPSLTKRIVDVALEPYMELVNKQRKASALPCDGHLLLVSESIEDDEPQMKQTVRDVLSNIRPIN